MSSLDKTILDSEETLSERLKTFQKEFYGILTTELSKFSNKGKLEPSDAQLAKLKKAIDDSFSKTKYKKYVEAYLSTFDLVDADNAKFYLENKLRIENYIINNDVLNELRRQTTENMLSKGMIDERLLKPIENLLRIDIIRGLSYQDAEETLKKYLVKPKDEESPFGNHIKNITRDALSQYDGALNNEVRKEYKLETMIYIGSLIETSRPFCIHMRDTQKRYTKEEVEKILDEYIPNGIPSTAPVTLEVNGKPKRTTKGSGMIEFTDINNLTINRGGYGCRHLIRWTK